MKTFAWTTLALLATGLAWAQDAADDELAGNEPLRRYTVEIIIFSYTEDVSVGSEIFVPDEAPAEALLPPDEDEAIPVFGDDVAPQAPDDVSDEELPPHWIVVPALDAAPGAVVQNPDGEEPNPFRLVRLAEDEFTLGDALHKFALLDAYETVMHFGWTQPAFPEDVTPAIDLALLGEPPAGLAGTFTLYLSRYLHLVVDLAMDAPDEFGAEVIDDDEFFSFGDARREYGGVMPIRFRIQDDRIFKNGDLRYFDHPRFGILAKVTRVEEPEPRGGDERPDSLAGGAR